MVVKVKDVVWVRRLAGSVWRAWRERNLGALLTGICQEPINPVFGAGKATGLLEENWSAGAGPGDGGGDRLDAGDCGHSIILSIVDKTIGLRVSAERSGDGSGSFPNGEEGYSGRH